MKVHYIFFILFLNIHFYALAQDWQFLGLGNEFIAALAIDTNDPEIIYAGSASNFSSGKAGGIFKSTNGGAEWDTLIRGVTTLDLDIHPINSQIIYASLGANALTQSGIIKSTDGGMSWFDADSGVVTNWEIGVKVLEIDPKHPETLYAGTGGPHGGSMYKSLNGGTDWRKLNVPRLGSVTCIAIDPLDIYHIFIGTADLGDIITTDNGGDSWYLTGLSEKGIIYDIKFNPYSSDTVCAGTSNYGFYMSTNSGATWTQNNNLLQERVAVLSVQFFAWPNYLNKPKIYINAEADLGIYFLNDNSEWEKFGNVGSWFITLSRDKIYACSYQGIYVSNILTSLENTDVFPSSINSYQNYPNPFNSSTQIRFEINKEKEISVVVFDILGRKVNTLLNERKSSGIYTLNWNGTDGYGNEVSSGLYICTLKAGSELQQLKMILTK